MDHTILFKLHERVVQTFCKECMEKFRTYNVSMCNASNEEFNCKFTAKIDFRTGIYIGSLKSLHTYFAHTLLVFGQYFDHMLVKFEQNRMIRTLQKFELFDKKNG